MASATQLPGPMEVSESGSAQGASLQAKAQAQFELGITLSLFLWSELGLAVKNNWGGPESAEKREWFAGQTIELLEETPDADTEYLETFLLQVMLDEFEVNVDDESGFEVAEQILRIRSACEKGDFSEVAKLKERWDKKGGKGEDVGKMFKETERDEREDETSGSEDDVEMEEAPQLVRAREPVVPEVDEDGFTKVTKKKR